MMVGLPIMLRVRRRRCVVIGGGAVAARKVDLLLRAGGDVLVVAPALCDRMAEHLAAGRVRHRAKRFAPRDIVGAAFVVSASDSRKTNACVAAAARGRGIPVNVVDDGAQSTATMPAIVDRNPVTIAMDTSGTSPVLARRLRARIEQIVPPETGRLARFAGKLRVQVHAALPDHAVRRKFWDEVFAGRTADLVRAGREPEALRRCAALLADYSRFRPRGSVYLVGAGPGDPELLTIKAARLLQSADLIVYDRLVGAGVLEYARRDAERIDVGKRRGQHRMPQSEINRLLIDAAAAGKCVVRLKGGDPFVFGRGGEEMHALRRAGIECEVVPGITAALGCAASAGIPLTHRDYAHSCVFVSGHSRSGRLELDWRLARPQQTLCVYMGLSNLDQIVRGLLRHGLSPHMPAAAILDGTTPRQRVVVGQLGNLARRVGSACAAAAGLVMIGEVVGLRGESAAESATILDFNRSSAHRRQIARSAPPDPAGLEGWKIRSTGRRAFWRRL